MCFCDSPMTLALPSTDIASLKPNSTSLHTDRAITGKVMDSLKFCRTHSLVMSVNTYNFHAFNRGWSACNEATHVMKLHIVPLCKFELYTIVCMQTLRSYELTLSSSPLLMIDLLLISFSWAISLFITSFSSEFSCSRVLTCNDVNMLISASNSQPG
jgi:hypothetical protein